MCKKGFWVKSLWVKSIGEHRDRWDAGFVPPFAGALHCFAIFCFCGFGPLHSMGFTAPFEVDCVLLGMRQPQYVLGTVPLLFATPPVHSEVGLGMAWTDGAERGTGQMG